MKHIFLACFASLSFAVSAQETISLSVRQKAELNEKSWVKEVPFERITTNRVGNKIHTFCINEHNVYEMVVAPNSGGLWYSKNGGETFVSLLHNQPTQQVNALAVDWKSKTIWVGTPYGVFTSTDMGKNWVFKGLAAVQNITSIVINPKNTEEVIVGVLGNKYNADEKRGIFKTTDGGKTWQHKLFVGTRAGIQQIVSTDMGKTLYVSVWETNDSQWESNPYGSLSCIYKSDNNGDTWNKISQGNGFPNGDFIGKIGLAAYDKNTIYAIVDNHSAKAKTIAPKSVEKTTQIHLSERDFETMNKSEFLNLDNQKLEVFLHNIGQNEKYTAQNLKNIIAAEITSPTKLLSFLGVKSKTIVGAEIYVSNDGGKSWTKTHSTPLDDTFYHNGKDFGSITVNPSNKNHILIGGYPLLESTDGGKSWKNKSSVSLQDGYYQVYFQNNIIFSATRKGLSVSFDGGKNWTIKNVPQSEDFGKIAYDKTKNTFYFAGNQGIFMQNNQWQRILDYSNIILGNKTYVGENNGIFYEFDNENGNLKPLGSMYFNENKAPLRFAKQTPLLVSPQNNDILYAGSNKLHISMDKGKTWRTISEDLTNGDKKGNKAYGTISAIAESPFLFGLIYTGSDDGMIYTSNNGGVSWQMIHNAFPKSLKVNNLIASKHERKRVLATLINNDENSREPYIFVSNDFGKTWSDIRSNLPESSINVLKEDPKNEQILYLGTDNGLYISFNLGESWHPFVKNLEQTGISDIFINENTSEMIVSTQGSGIYKASVEALQQLRVAITSQDFYPIHDKIRVPYSTTWGNTWSQWATTTTPQIAFCGFAAKEGLPLNIKIMKGKTTLQTLTHKTNKGFNYITYDLTISEVGKIMYEKTLQKLFLTSSSDGKVYLPKGKYTVVFSIDNGFDEERELDIY